MLQKIAENKKSIKDNGYYIGYTFNLKQRLKQHADGFVISTKYRRPLLLVYYEVCFNQESAINRERYLKTTYGRRYLKNRIHDSNEGLKI